MGSNSRARFCDRERKRQQNSVKCRMNFGDGRSVLQDCFARPRSTIPMQTREIWAAYGHYRNGILLTPATAHLGINALDDILIMNQAQVSTLIRCITYRHVTAGRAWRQRLPSTSASQAVCASMSKCKPGPAALTLSCADRIVPKEDNPRKYCSGRVKRTDTTDMHASPPHSYRAREGQMTKQCRYVHGKRLERCCTAP